MNPKSINTIRFIKEEKYNIAKKDWLVRALGSDKPLTELIKFTPDDMIYATKALAKELENDDDSETPPINLEELTSAVDQVDANVSNNCFENQNGHKFR